MHKIVEVTLDIKLIKINYENQQIALHERCEAKGQFITNKAHYPKYKLYEPHSLEYQNKYHDKLKAIEDNMQGIYFLCWLNIIRIVGILWQKVY